MLTRLEVQGFKNLLDVAIDFGPFTCIAGANGMGKSNVFDAIEFLSYLATEPLAQAAQRVRGTAGVIGGDPRDLFWDGYRQHEHRITLAAEMIVPVEVEDELGELARPTATYLRYEVTLGYGPSRAEHGSGRLHLLREDLRQVEDARAQIRFPASSAFLDSVVLDHYGGRVFLSTDRQGMQGVSINVHADGDKVEKSRSVGRAARTVLSTTITADNPTIFAARNEMRRWRRLALEPSALRTPDDETGPESLGPEGRHLPSTLYRIAHAPDWSGDPDRIYATVAGRLSDLAGVAVEALDVEFDEVRQTFTLFLQERGGLRLPARALSEGTLRFLALCVLLEDADFSGLICMEEPENGIHPGNLPAMVQLVRDLAVDPTEPPSNNNPFRQVIINTHSPGVVQLCDPSDLLLADAKLRPAPGGGAARTLSLLPFRQSWRAVSEKPTFSEADIVAYLAEPPDAQLRLPSGLMT
ncbi:AAA family ATPase [Micromonospora sp. 4G57]|uniref:AAA family ATPase n=1 Tax=Micromonospora sicca TaxID=2202420 RepID=A0ABU5JKC1_9ACTN|nr:MULTISPECIES: AAA family ATPase [unclassified Micromonospora]MDZ5446448.1 AAA family ATPase [Micromonospora sp. 4G57]MDZ5493021.1 AAA family ATPase [Micromonospora sp. 4G53]